MGKRVLRVRNALTGKVREVALPGKPAAKNAASKKVAVKDVKVELKADVSDFARAIEKGARDGADID